MSKNMQICVLVLVLMIFVGFTVVNVGSTRAEEFDKTYQNGGNRGDGSGLAYQDPAKDVVEKEVGEELTDYPFIDILYIEAADNGVDKVTAKMTLAAPPARYCNYFLNVNQWGAQCMYSKTDETYILYGQEKVTTGISQDDRNITWIINRTKLLEVSSHRADGVESLNSSAHYYYTNEFYDFCNAEVGSTEVPVGTGPAASGYSIKPGLALQDPAKDVVEKGVDEPLDNYPRIDILYLEAFDDKVDTVTVTMVLAAPIVDGCKYYINVNKYGAQGCFSIGGGLWLMYGSEKVTSGISASDRNITWVIDRDKLLNSSSHGTLCVENLNGSSITWHQDKEFIDICDVSAGSTEVAVGTGPATGGYGGDGGDGGDGKEGPQKMTIILEIISLTKVKQTMKTYPEGEAATELRNNFDMNQDGTVTKDEKDSMLDTFQSMGVEASNWTLDGKTQKSYNFSADFEGVLGSVNNQEPINMSIMITYEFNVPTESNTHSYSNEDMIGSSDEGPGEVTNDSSMKVIAPSGWSFDTTGWPQVLKNKLKSDGTIIELNGTTIREYWNETLGQLNEIKIKKGTTGDGGDGGDGGDVDGDGMEGVQKMSMILEFLSLTQLKQTMKMYPDVEAAAELRNNLDMNQDGTITKDEKEFLLDNIQNMGTGITDWTLDGNIQKSYNFSATLEGVLGSISSQDPIIMSYIVTYEFNVPTESNTHSYSNEDMTDPSNEGVGEVTDDSSMKIIAPSGWSFDTTGWPQKLKDKLKSSGTIIELDGTTIREYWNETVGRIDEIKIKKGTDGDGGDGGDGSDGDDDEGAAAIIKQPYFPILIIIIIIIVVLIIAAVAMRKKKKGATRTRTRDERVHREEKPEPKEKDTKPAEKSTKKRLTELKKLKEDGLINDDEFNKKKDEILKEL